MKTTPFRRLTCLATLVAFVLTFSLADWAAAQATTLTPPPYLRPAPTPVPGAAPRQTRLQIEHDPLACVTTVRAPVVEAKVQPGPDVSNSYVYWRAPGTPYYYVTLMQGPVPDVKGVIPRPLPETTSVEYYVQATDTSSLSRKTPDYAPPVVKSDVCKDNRGLLVGAAGAGLTIGLTDARQPAIPPGFNKDDIAKVILVTGAVVGVAEATAATSGSATAAGAASGTGAGAAGAGGMSTGLIVAGAAVAAAGIGYGVDKAVNNNNAPTPTRTVTPNPTPTPVPNHFIEVEATWSGVGKVDTIQLFKDGLPVSGQTLPAGCASTTSRTTRFIAQGASVTDGSYYVTVTGGSCGAGTPSVIAALVGVQTDVGQKCSGIVNVPSNGSDSSPKIACTFHMP